VKNRKILQIFAALLWGFLSCISIITPVSAAPRYSQSATLSEHQHLTGCTPGSYHLASKIYILDQGTYTVMGYVAIYADGCGWVQAEALGGTLPSGYFGIVNHLTIYNSNGQAITSGTYSAGPYQLTAPVPTHGDYFYAVGVIQDAPDHYWGAGQTYGANGYWYSSTNGPLD
jgi:hypothetical protein